MPEKYGKFRNPSNQRLLGGLFLETRPPGQVTEPLYTLRDWNHTRPNGDFLPSLYVLYMAMEDLTEYEFANTHLDGWEHWLRLCESPFFKPFAKRWREELSLKIKAEALHRVKEAARDPSNKSYHEANKYLVNELWKAKEGKGRPTKAQVAKAAKEAAMTLSEVNADYERINPNVANQEPQGNG